jgi:hypothetical protein
MIDQLKALLGTGVPPAQAAAAVGCSPAYVSQLLATESFALEVSTLRVAKLQEATTRDGKYDGLEDKLLKKLEDLLPFMMRPTDVLKALVAVNAAKRRGATADDQKATTVNNIVIVKLPQAVRERYLLNEQKEVVEVAGRPLVTIDGRKLLTQVKETLHANQLPLASAEI